MFVLLSCITFLLASIGISVVQAAGAATLTLSPATIALKTGDTFTATVVMTPNVEVIDMARVELAYDASKIEMLSFSNGLLFPNYAPGNWYDNNKGTFTYGVYKYGVPVTSTGTMVTMKFRALSAGSSTVAVLNTSKVISDGVEKLNVSALGSMTVTTTGVTVAQINPSPAQPIDIVAVETSVVPAPAPVITVINKAWEATALKYFGAFFAHMPSSENDWKALHCMAYGGCQPNPRDIQKEQIALETFGAKYGKMPATTIEWNVLHTIAYTDLLIAHNYSPIRLQAK